jgi:hypothetical protein
MAFIEKKVERVTFLKWHPWQEHIKKELSS